MYHILEQFPETLNHQNKNRNSHGIVPWPGYDLESANEKGAKFVIISAGSPKKLRIENFFAVENSKVEKNLKKIIKFREKCSKKKNCSKGMKIRKGLFYWLLNKAI